jgi:hypothetical protein
LIDAMFPQVIDQLRRLCDSINPRADEECSKHLAGTLLAFLAKPEFTAKNSGAARQSLIRALTAADLPPVLFLPLLRLPATGAAVGDIVFEAQTQPITCSHYLYLARLLTPHST